MKFFLVVFLLVTFSQGYSQGNYWQQQVNFNITASLNDETHSIDGFESIEYINNSPDTLQYIWFHLWPNAYKNDRTAFSEQLLLSRRTDFYFSDPADKGYINRLDFKANGQNATIEATQQIDVIKLWLPAPLAPGNKTTITTPFHVQLPYYFSRSGHVGNDYQVTQWFPKPAVYDAKGWHPMPYLDQGEFYSEFGNFDVEITTPKTYIVAATGVLQDTATLMNLKENKKLAIAEATNTWHYKQENVHDFAWFASKDFKVNYDTAILPSGKVVDVFAFYKKDNEAWKSATTYAKDGLKHYSKWLGDYPYSTVSVVEGPANVSSGGMEYPTITLITTNETGRELDATIVHEVGHNWFYGALASNERQHPWMDEGMNTYYQQRYEAEKYGTESTLQKAAKGLAGKLPSDEENLLIRTIIKLKKDQPIALPSEAFSPSNYGLMIYKKAPLWMLYLEQKLGTAAFDNAMKTYYNTWQHKHPYPADFKKVMEQATGQSLVDAFAQLNTLGPLKKDDTHRVLKPTLLFSLKDTEKYQYINISPVIGYNYYDKIMPGLMVHNYQLPINKFNFIAGGLYGSGSGKLNSFARTSYHTWQKNHDIEAAVSYMNFSQNDFTPGAAKTLYPRFRRIVPSIKLTLFNKDPLHNRRFSIQLKTFLLKEDQLDFRTIITPQDTIDVVGLKEQNTTINRLVLNYGDDRVLYPYSINLTADQGKNFIRAGLTAQYFFNYAEEDMGLKARFFAGKFFFLNSKTIVNSIAADRFALNMTGPKGYEDYTYSNYFVGRNEFDGFLSQQIMERDGFFKVRTDFLSNKIGKSDDWLMSLNLTSDLPNQINPLRVLPVKIPLKVFADVGTYAEAWKQNSSTGRFLFDAGLQVPLFHSVVNVYIPILYSRVYSDYFKSILTKNRFLTNISFSIDIQKLQLKKLLPGIPL